MRNHGLPDTWNYSVRGLSSITPDGVDGVLTALKELERLGYLERNQQRESNGQMGRAEYVIYEMPRKKPCSESPCTEKPYTVNPDTDTPVTENPAQLREKYKELNIKIQDKKFYCQHYSKGVKFCGSTIKYNRIYPNKRTVRSLTRKIIGFNKVKDKKKFIKDFVNSINSYFGILKQCNSNRIIIESVRRINEQWFEYVQWNPHRRIIEPKPCYDFHHSLSDRYGLEIEHFNKKHKYYYGKP